ncbi:TPA: hypothetical protein PCX98_003644 [Klebsiella aerogenes]|uniref:hypothetical protein n=1 Tax=Klebsiella aerogenes TaxID=548 RepID=UPI000F6D58B7|nr:hypothetical protein [Klebsiella aerogenes]MEC4756946.1 hypothetical protein [Klebsiella aerogenes]QEU20377.1 hypothetical protein FOB49_17840 [Klebsiella aerogenes]QXB10458.1 hypothetical protein I6L72_01195 [Klebsiella aerogenes]VDZ70106.1 Protein of uncharacterised function (DUF1493) [Klebsiella aerogenes]HDG1154640.1 hypothetical protein [Klebsiella aerogenes]
MNFGNIPVLKRKFLGGYYLSNIGSQLVNRMAFGLKKNEYLFGSESLDLPCITRFIDWLRSIPSSAVNDLTMDPLHQALVNVTRRRQKKSEVWPHHSVNCGVYSFMGPANP